MMNFLPGLYEGHASITLQHLFRDAIYAFDEWENGDAEPTVMHEGRLVPISLIFTSMRDCTDIAPRGLIDIVTDHLSKPWTGEDSFDRMSFSVAARIMSVLVRKRRLHGEAGMVAFMDHHQPLTGNRT